jgi:hypothetical protein
VSSHLTGLTARHVGIIAGKKLKIRVRGSLQWQNIHTKFHQNPSIGSDIQTHGRKAETTNLTRLPSFVHIVQRSHAKEKS